jgi:hypothetical protein
MCTVVEPLPLASLERCEEKTWSVELLPSTRRNGSELPLAYFPLHAPAVHPSFILLWM